MQRRLSSVWVVGALVLAGLAVLPAEPAWACSCAGPTTPEASVAASEVAFVGTILEVEPEFQFRMRVEGVARGDLADEVLVSGSDASGGCGPDYGTVGQRVGVLGRRDGDRIVGRACSFITAKELEEVQPQPPPTSSAPIAALAAVGYMWANVVALDADGAVVSSGHLPFFVRSIAPCHGTTQAVAVGSEEGSAVPVAEVVDLRTMTTNGERLPVPDGQTTYAGSFACVMAGSTPTLVSVPGPVESGHGVVAVSQVDGTIAEARIEGSASQVITPSGAVVVTPARRGQPLQILDPEGLSPTAELSFGPDVVLDAAISPDGSTLAALVVDTEVLTYGQDPEAIQLVDLTGPVPRLGLRLPIADEPGQANRISWDSHGFIVDRELFDRRHYDLIGFDGTLTASTAGPVGGGSRVQSIGDIPVAVSHAGIVGIGADGTTTVILDTGGAFGTIASFIDGPAVDPSTPPEHLYRPTEPAAAVLEPPPPASHDRSPTDDLRARRGAEPPWLVVLAGVLGASAAAGLLALRRRTRLQA